MNRPTALLAFTLASLFSGAAPLAQAQATSGNTGPAGSGDAGPGNTVGGTQATPQAGATQAGATQAGAPANTAPAAPATPGSNGSGTGTASTPPSVTTPPGPAQAVSTATSPPAVPLAADALAVKPGHYRLDPDHGKVTWSVNHLGFSTYVGQFPGVTADLDLDPRDLSKTTLTATVNLVSVDTANPKLDDQIKGDGFFAVTKFPEATFKSTRIVATGPRTARIDGTLTMRGKTSPIVISATFNNAGVDPVDKQYTVGFEGATIIRRSTFGVSQYVPLVGDDVLVRLEGEFKPAS